MGFKTLTAPSTPSMVDTTSWVEAHLQTNENLGGVDLGWQPFQACPPPPPISVLDVNRSTGVHDRSGSEALLFQGRLVFTENGTPIENTQVRGHIIPETAALEPPFNSLSAFGSSTTNETGWFTMTSNPPPWHTPDRDWLLS